MSTGYLHLFHVRGMPIRMHWSVLVLVAYVLGENDHAAAGLLGFLTIIVAHELGHAVLVRKYGLRVHGIQLHPFGGECVHDAPRRVRTDSIIAWGGVLAQLVLCAGAVAVLTLSPPGHPQLGAFLHRLVVPNLVMAAFNLLPIKPLDGSRAWRLFFRREPESSAEPRVALRIAPAAKASSAASSRLRVLTHDEQHQLGALVDDALEQAKTASKQR